MREGEGDETAVPGWSCGQWEQKGGPQSGPPAVSDAPTCDAACDAQVAAGARHLMVLRARRPVVVPGGRGHL